MARLSCKKDFTAFHTSFFHNYCVIQHYKNNAVWGNDEL